MSLLMGLPGVAGLGSALRLSTLWDRLNQRQEGMESGPPLPCSGPPRPASTLSLAHVPVPCTLVLALTYFENVFFLTVTWGAWKKSLGTRGLLNIRA